MLAASMDTSLQELYPEMDPDMLATIGRIYVTIMLVVLVFSAVIYVLHSVGLYSVAKRRKIPHPWLAWLPIGGNWILGSISDRYQFVCKNRFQNRKKLLACMELATYVLEGAIAFSFISLLINTQTLQTTAKIPTGWLIFDGTKLAPQYKDLSIIMPPRQDDILASAQLVLLLIGVSSLVALVFSIFQYIAYYDLFTSCRPGQKMVFLVLGILFPVTLPFFVFACRNKYDCMSPGVEEQAQHGKGGT